MKQTQLHCCGHVNRRVFLADCGMGFTGLVLGAMLKHDGFGKEVTRSEGAPTGKPHFTPKVKSVIWIFMIGGVSHVECFDPKGALNHYAGKTIEETPYPDIINSPFVKKNVRGDDRALRKPKLFPMQVGYKKRGGSGIEITDWWPHLGECVDDIALVRSMWTTDNDHGAQLQFHTGRHFLEGNFPTIGSWVHYGLGNLSENLPQFVVLGHPVDACCGGIGAHGGNYLGPQHSGVQLSADPGNPLAYGSPASNIYREEQEREFALLSDLNRLAGVEYPSDPVMQARIKSYELAFRMQLSVPKVFRFEEENGTTQKLYGLDQEETRPFGQLCLGARRLVEQGVRFVQVYHGGGGGGAGAWDAHSNLKKGHTKLCRQVDQPIAALLQDLKQRGMLEETLVVWGTEFGRTPGSDSTNGPGDGRDHHPYGFSAWLAGGGIKKGVVHGATDELGYHAVEHRHYVTDLHATVLHQLGLDPHELEVPGRKRLEIDFGEPIREILA
jgi:hypothetical protein